ncbi:hypothetical protein P3T43_004480 [Paraburkholderia sp. GAS41]|uniref:hypothetical protein n=1 Tax=Paraburkholderia sp. GAS41 TaxID=3035134 RepID=UPI003D1FA7D5
MLRNVYRRFTAWLGRSRSTARTAAIRQTTAPGSAFDFDPMWHGDHWQNLLSSPMDARHYVMEDWSVAIATVYAPAGLAAPIR